MEQWSYKLVPVDMYQRGQKIDILAIEEKLRELGVQGWEVAGVMNNVTTGATELVVILKRRPPQS